MLELKHSIAVVVVIPVVDLDREGWVVTGELERLISQGSTLVTMEFYVPKLKARRIPSSDYTSSSFQYLRLRD